jgi:hypothetical protein
MLELKSIKVAEKLSEETYCFTANLYYKGKKIGEVSNRGCGGCNDLHLQDNSLYAEIEAYAKSLPEVDCYGEMLAMDLDFLISTKVEEYLAQQDEKRVQKFIAKQIKANQAKGMKTLKLTSNKDVSCLAIKPDLMVTQEVINQYQTKYNLTITNWEVI